MLDGVTRDDTVHGFRTATATRWVALPFNLEEFLHGWQTVVHAMVRSKPEGFSRDEWAYVMAFLDQTSLMAPFQQNFGELSHTASEPSSVFCPRGTVAVWLPSNVSLLGPLMTVLIGLSGNAALLKGPSEGTDLTAEFLRFVGEHAPNGPVREFVDRRVRVASFSRDDTRNAEYAARADVRCVFGTNQAAEAVDRLSHPIHSIGFHFTDRVSEAWIEAGAVSEEVVDALIKVFGIFGRAGCTSPRRVVVVDGTNRNAAELSERLVERWPAVIPERPSQHIASSNVMARQLASALGWRVAVCGEQAAVIAVGGPELDIPEAPMILPIIHASVKTAVAGLPENIQTVGHRFRDIDVSSVTRSLLGTGVKRIVPLTQMHNFGPVWDGYGFWRQFFEEIQVAS